MGMEIASVNRSATYYSKGSAQQLQGQEDQGAVSGAANKPGGEGTGDAARAQTGKTADKTKITATAAGSATSEDPKTQAQIQELVQIQNKVIIHEQAHKSAGGELAGAASYTYTTGPDGKRYISGGEVSISMPATDNPEEKVRMYEKVRAAALAPADPSPQDRRVAASASANQAKANMELARQRTNAAYGKSKEGVPQPTNSTEDRAVKNDKKQKTPVGSMLDIAL